MSCCRGDVLIPVCLCSNSRFSEHSTAQQQNAVLEPVPQHISARVASKTHRAVPLPLPDVPRGATTSCRWLMFLMRMINRGFVAPYVNRSWRRSSLFFEASAKQDKARVASL